MAPRAWWRRSDAAQVDPAVRRARLVVGLYGDPSVAWSIVLRLTLTDDAEPLLAEDVAERWRALVLAHPGLGRAGRVLRYPPEEQDSQLAAFADRPYGDRDPLLRVGLDREGRELLVAGHHGGVDGLGLVGAAGALAGLELGSNARGVAADADDSSFVRGSLRRLVEALARPPLRLAHLAARRGRGDLLASRAVTGTPVSTPALVLAACRATRQWNAHPSPGSRVSGRRLVVALGLSRRPGTPMPPPDRDTAYARLDADDLTDLTRARALVGDLVPEPAFPVSEGLGVGPLVTRLLSSRLGSTVLVSNLGRIDEPRVERLEFWPVPAGPAGACLGLASTPTSTTLTARLRRPWFDGQDASRLADLAAEGLAEAAGEPPRT